jgi:hypothetical protein
VTLDGAELVTGDRLLDREATLEESMQNRGDRSMPTGIGSVLTGRGWAGAEAGVACEAGCGAASRGDD